MEIEDCMAGGGEVDDGKETNEASASCEVVMWGDGGVRHWVAGGEKGSGGK